MPDNSYAEREKLVLRKHQLERENLAARRAVESARHDPLSGIATIRFGRPDPFDVEEAELKEKQTRELLDLVKEELASAKPKGSEPERKRFSGTVTSPSAARKMEAFIDSQGIGFTEFANKAGTTDRTIRQFRKTGKVRRDIFQGIARVMGLKLEDLLK